MVWNPLFLDPSDGVFGRFDLAAHVRLLHLFVWWFGFIVRWIIGVRMLAGPGCYGYWVGLSSIIH